MVISMVILAVMVSRSQRFVSEGIANADPRITLVAKDQES